MSQVFQQLELSVGSLGQDWGAERLHDLLDGDILVCELIAGRAVREHPQLVLYGSRGG